MHYLTQSSHFYRAGLSKVASQAKSPPTLPCGPTIKKYWAMHPAAFLVVPSHWSKLCQAWLRLFMCIIWCRYHFYRDVYVLFNTEMISLIYTCQIPLLCTIATKVLYTTRYSRVQQHRMSNFARAQLWWGNAWNTHVYHLISGTGMTFFC